MRYKFEDIAVNSTAKKKPTVSDKDTYLGLEHLDSGSLTITRFGSEVAPIGEKLIMKKGDVLFGKRRAYQKKVAIAPFDGIFSAHGMVLRPKEAVVDKDFFPLFISSDYFLDAAIKISVGSLSPTINWRDLKELEFGLPSLDEQRRLAKVFWSAIEARNAYKELLALTEQLVKSQFVEMFGDPVTNPMGWEVKQLGEYCYVTKLAGFEYTNYIHYQDQGDVIMIKGLNVKDRKLKLDDLSYIDKSVSDSLPRSQLKPDDVVMTYIGINIGDVALIDDRYLYHLAPNVAKITPLEKDKTDSVFLVNLLHYCRELFASSATNTAKQALNMDRIRKISTIVPPLDLQNRFADFVRQADKSKFELQRTIDELEATYKSLLRENLG